MAEPFRFAWCDTNQHNMCRGSYRRIYVDDKNKVHETGETRHCGCPCHGGDA